MSVAIRRCPACGRENRPTDLFCAACATSLESSSVEVLLRPTVATIPARPFGRRRNVPDGAGSGLVTIGLLLAGLAVVINNPNLTGNALLWGGVAIFAIGLIRMRRDLTAMTRVGAAVTALGAGALLVVTVQSADRLDWPFTESDEAIPIATTALEEPVEHDTPESSPGPAGNGLVANVGTYRGGPLRTGEHPGPGPDGDPRLAWRFDSAGEVLSAPSVADGMLYFGTRSGFVIALDAATGDEHWRYDLGSYIVRASPAVVNNTVYIGGGYHLYALDARTGVLQWRTAMRLAGPSSPVVVDGVVYICSQSGVAYAFAADTGERQWEFRSEGLVFSSPAVSDTSVYFGGDDGSLYALDRASGRQRWRLQTQGAIYATPVIDDGRVYITDKAQVAYAIDADSGRERWRFAAGGESSPVVVDGVVYVGSDDSGVVAIDAESGEALWLFATGAPVTSSPTLADDVLYVGSGPTLYALNLDGTQRWRYPLGDTIEASPTVVGGRIFIGARDGYLTALGGAGTTASATPPA